ncbi:MAG: hypothetical protein E7212_07175 [Clostridium sartagoforme]|nr:hypothetical protein [Clostridium sartagoforme]
MSGKSKFITLVISVCIIGGLIYYFNTYKGGNIENVSEGFVKSEVYSEDEIKDAMEIVKKKFQKDFKGCTLTDLWYGENISRDSEEEWAKQYNADEAIVLFSNFDVDSSGGDGSLNPNTTYKDWKWVLVRNKSDEKWVLKTWGLG